MVNCIAKRAFCYAGQFVLSLVTIAGIAIAVPSSTFANTLLHEIKAIPAPTGARELCQSYPWACDRSTTTSVLDTATQLRLAAEVNREINRKVRAVSDQNQYGRKEVWTLPTARGGDCEDFALLKKKELIRIGLAPSRLSIATALDRRRNSHAVLIIRTKSGDYVLDNLTNQMKPWQDTGYSFLRMQDPNTPSGWTRVMRGGVFPP